jgi:mRNA interferase MazF
VAEPAIRRGEIYWVDWSPARGSEQAGRRPALVVQGDAGNQSSTYPNTIVVAISTHGREIPLHVRLPAGTVQGLAMTSYIKCEQILTISKERLSRERAGRIDDRTMADVEAAIRLSLALKSRGRDA